ncbi:unnamed protein product, partial [marine sediment metagenome]
MTNAGALRKLFRREVAKEKAHMLEKTHTFGQSSGTPPVPELAAGEGTYRQEAQSQYGVQRDAAPRPGEPERETGMPLVRAASGARVVSRTDPGAGWAQYNPFRKSKDDDEQEKPKEANAVTMYLAAK